MKPIFVYPLALCFGTAIVAFPAQAQMGGMDMGGAPAATPTPEKPMDHSQMDHSKMNHEGMNHEAMGHTMRSTTDVAVSMSRESSGTAWQPDSSPMYMAMKMRGRDQLALHGTFYPRYTTIGGNRDVSVAGQGGTSRFDAPSMLMGMYVHPLDKSDMPRSQLGIRAMLSADPLIERGYGYPLLFQSGEVYKGQPLHDRQHPHDLFSELSVTYSRRVGSKQSAYLYLGYPGEPALGPPTFMHRISGMDFADAPLSHHWQDSTHITFGVATLGYNFGKFKLEGSSFNGREPDENRYNFDTMRLNSYSGRLSWNPTRDVALQVSHGFLKSPETSHPDENQHRTTASILYNHSLGEDANLATAFVYGQNAISGESTTHAYTLETALQKQKNTVFLRAEHVQKTGEELVLNPADAGNIYGINALSIGYVRDLSHGKGVDVGLGIQGTFADGPSGLNSYYGSGVYKGFQVFFRIRPSRMKMNGMGMTGMGSMDGASNMGDMPMTGK
ncbi:hypothetical protein EON83_07525 [bacterium]|nr:MAG: hypothetical protein EON83_07525 [bacterium]